MSAHFPKMRTLQNKFEKCQRYLGWVSPFIQSAFFPHIQKGDYWSQTQSHDIDTQALTHLKEGAVAVSFKHGTSRVLPFRNAAHTMLVADTKEKAPTVPGKYIEIK
ncbi:hypothetical protein BM527_16295 [Alteromonas sp. Mex14]|nr:hypothetical protein BM527_16295 [Alteromonas sp. Mex14]